MFIVPTYQGHSFSFSFKTSKTVTFTNFYTPNINKKNRTLSKFNPNTYIYIYRNERAGSGTRQGQQGIESVTGTSTAVDGAGRAGDTTASTAGDLESESTAAAAHLRRGPKAWQEAQG